MVNISLTISLAREVSCELP